MDWNNLPIGMNKIDKFVYYCDYKIRLEDGLIEKVKVNE
jgi:hypothetical protein